MKTFEYRSAYLLPRSASQRRLWLGLWQRSLQRRRWLTRRTAFGLGCWMVVVLIGSWSMQHHQLGLPSTVTPGTALAASKQGVNELAAGPTGQLLPPGTLATYGTYANRYSAGQCTWYVASRRPVPGNWGNARSWYAGAQNAGWSTGSVPAIGAIAWTPAGYYGHVSVVVAVSAGQVEVSEMNYYGPYRIDQRWTTSSSWHYIY